MPTEEPQPMVTAVLDVARRQLGEVGPAALSLRAIAREVGVVPSALYRYLPGREAILTELITSSYERLAEAVHAAESAVDRRDRRARWLATWRAARQWSVAHPHEYALLYGTPVAGYRAPATTVVPATAVVLTLARIAVDTTAPPGDAAAAVSARDDRAIPASLLVDLERLVAVLPELGFENGAGIAPSPALTVIDAWTSLFGTISFELFGHYVGSISAHGEHLDRLAEIFADRLGLPDSAG